MQKHYERGALQGSPAELKRQRRRDISREPTARSRRQQEHRRGRSREWARGRTEQEERFRSRRARSRDTDQSLSVENRSRRLPTRSEDSENRSYRRLHRRRRRSGPYSSDDDSRRRQSRKKTRRRRNRSSPRFSPRSPADLITRRAGVVSDDEPDPTTPAKKRSSSASSRNDSIGHFRGPPGTLIADRYRLQREVGMGTFGRVVECVDEWAGNRQREKYVAIKIVRDVKRYYDSALIEAGIVKDVNRRGGRGITHCAVLFTSFTWINHYCMVFEALGPSLYDFVRQHNYQPFPMMCVRDFARQILETLEFLHSFRLVHTDLKLENILLTNYREVPYRFRGRVYQIPESSKVKIIDFGGATYDTERKSSIVNTRQYRAPEVILGCGWSMPSDLWSAGCILAELYLGQLLFATHDNLEHLALMEKAIGPFPGRLLDRASNKELVSEAFDDRNRVRVDRVLSSDSASFVHKTRPLDTQIRKEDHRFLDLLTRILVIDPDVRATARDCSRHPL